MLRLREADDLPVTVDPSRRSPSGAWLAGAVLAGLLALSSLVGAFFHQQEVDRPVGEGELFVADAAEARTELEKAETGDLALAVRRVRNMLAIEAVSLVDADGRIIASTSPNQEARELSNGLLRYGLSSGFFAAVATSIDTEIQIDGVTEWEDGAILYHVLEPLDNGEGLLLYYDVSELLARRARQQGIQPLTLQLVGVGAFFMVAGILLLIARSAVARRIRDMEIESQFLRQQSSELEEHNQQLAAARAEAERALALAEEKNRIRAEFVLMINHELRTPLTSLVTGAELLSQLGLPEADRIQLLSHMVADGKRLQEMIAQMLTVARIENRGLNFTLRDVPFAEVLTDLKEKHPRLRIQRRAGGVEPEAVYVRTDPMTLSQLVASLADNALSHGATRVDLVWQESLPFRAMHEVGQKPDPALFLLVIDDGPGIDPAFLPRAFEKFEKHSKSAGTGLGLYIARMMVDALEGSLSVHSSRHGTTMAIGVPLGRRLQVESAA
ncbi:MAG TPA: HAMP domain-containing sensor histidine kinase [Acidimicrobiia bacterium]|jgi:signal transduction histidine kinase|nr:HAMP domain-containing sensor histidine kinase [Acidimicrobiia bacterium]